MATMVERGSSSDKGTWCGCLSGEAITALWDTIRPFFLERRHDLTEFSEPEDILKQVIAGRLDLWLVLSEIGAVEGMLMAYPEKHKNKCIYVLRWATGRNLHKHKQKVLKEIEEYALAGGATHIQVIGRKGWTRVLRGWKYKQTAIVLEKDLRRTRMN